jgi:hypothetical protein
MLVKFPPRTKERLGCFSQHELSHLRLELRIVSTVSTAPFHYTISFLSHSVLRFIV